LRTAIVIFICLMTQTAKAQHNFTIRNFTKAYYGKVRIAKCDSSGFCHGKGDISIFRQGNNKKLIHLQSKHLVLWLHNGKAKANVERVPYGEQSVIIYKDLNFDGKKDFALQGGLQGCYNTPSFKIYLAKKHGFKYSKSFTQLSRGNCGMFRVNKKDQRLLTMSKSGCCEHYFSSYKVTKNKPFLVRKEVTKSSDQIMESDIKKRKKGQMVEHKEIHITADSNKVRRIFSFQLKRNKAKANVLLTRNDTTQNDWYMRIIVRKRNGNLKFIAPELRSIGNQYFILKTSEDSSQLSIKTTKINEKGNEKKIHYILFRKTGAEKQIGLKVNKNNHTETMNGNLFTIEGSLNDLKKFNIRNLKE